MTGTRILALALVVAAASPSGAAEEPGPTPPASPPTRAAVDAAAARGVAFLLSDQRPDGGWISREYGMGSAGHKTAVTASAMDALLAAGGPTPDVLAAVGRGLAFLEKNAPELDAGIIQHGFDFNGWGAAYGLRHLAGLRDRWPAGTKAPDLARLVALFTAWAVKNRHPCGGWTYLTKEQDPRYAKDGSVSFLTGVMIEGLALWDRESPLVPAAAEDLSKSCDGEGRALYSHAGDWPAQGRGREESAGRSLQAAFVLEGLGKRTRSDLEKRLAEFLAVRQEYVKTRTQHPHTPPHMIAGYYYYHAHSYAARALRRLAEGEGAPSAERERRVATLLGALLSEQDDAGAWMDAPCGDRPYATSLALLSLVELRDLLFPWSGSLETAVAAAREDGRPVVVLLDDGDDRSRQAAEGFTAKELDGVRPRCLWVRAPRAEEAAWRGARSARGGMVLVLGPEGEWDPAKAAARFTTPPSAKTLLRALERVLAAAAKPPR